MSLIISVLLAVSIAGFVLGMLSPNLLFGKFINNPTRNLVLKIFGSLLILFLFLSVMTSKDEKKSETSTSEKEIGGTEKCSAFKASKVYNKESTGTNDPRIFAFVIKMDFSKDECWERLTEHSKEIHEENRTLFRIYYTSRDIGKYDFYNIKLPKEIVAVLYANMAQAVFTVDPENYNRRNKSVKIWCSYDCKK